MRSIRLICLTVIVLIFTGTEFSFGQTKFTSHSPMRPLPTATKRPLATGPTYFVDATKGDDTQDGSKKKPWKTMQHGVRQLKPGDTLYLRGGTYFEKVSLTQSGTAEAPITIASYPGEEVILDGGLREFSDSPETTWKPNPDGAEGEYVSTRTYFHLDTRKVPQQFLPGAWEPLWGKEEQRPLALGNFADSMVPLHGYRNLVDLRSTNELRVGKNDKSGVYCGPGMWYNRKTGRIHIRLAHHKLERMGKHGYRGETDPRKLRLVVAVGFGDEVLRINGVRHVRIQGLVLRGATGSPMIHLYGSEHVELDHLTVFGGFPGLLINACKNIRVTNCAFRGLAAPWSSRSSMKYFGTASYQIVLSNNQPVNEDIEFAYCEFTDDHDFAFLRFAKNLKFHHNYVDNFNDDGLECGAKLRWHTIYIYQNYIGRCLIPFTQHEIDRDESPLEHDPKSGVYIYRNVIDLRGGTFRGPPAKADKTGAFLRFEGHLVGDHGGPTWPVMYFYHNTTLRHTPVFRDYYLFGLGAQAMRNTERDVFNNIFVQTDRLPGIRFTGPKQAANIREGGNLIWSPKQGPTFEGDVFAKFRASPLFEDSKNRYKAGWTTHDRVADPKFVNLPNDESLPKDLRLQPGSPAIDAGRKVVDDWPDPLRLTDKGAPDIGAMPRGVDPWSIGIRGRMSVFGMRK